MSALVGPTAPNGSSAPGANPGHNSPRVAPSGPSRAPSRATAGISARSRPRSARARPLSRVSAREVPPACGGSQRNRRLGVEGSSAILHYGPAPAGSYPAKAGMCNRSPQCDRPLSGPRQACGPTDATHHHLCRSAAMQNGDGKFIAFSISCSSCNMLRRSRIVHLAFVGRLGVLGPPSFRHRA